MKQDVILERSFKNGASFNSSVMFDVDSLKDNEVFKELLGYINKP